MIRSVGGDPNSEVVKSRQRCLIIMSKNVTRMAALSPSSGKPTLGRTHGQTHLFNRVNCVSEHSKSDITHKPGPIFAEATHGYVLLHQRGKVNFVLVAESVLGSDLRIGSEVEQVLALVATPVEHFPNLPGFAWTVSLPLDDRQKMRDDLVLSLRQAMEKGATDSETRWHPYDQAVYEWRATADVLADPELTHRLLDDWSEEDEVVLSRP